MSYSCLGKQELVELVDKYASRVYDDDLVYID